MKMKLFHGRHNPAMDMDDWGYDGPVLKGIKYAHTTYLSHLRIAFKTKEAADIAQGITGWSRFEDTLEPIFHSDMIYIPTQDSWFGDWSFYVED